MTRDEIELYVMGAYDGDVAALERSIDDDPEARARLADEAGFEGLLREAAGAAKQVGLSLQRVRQILCETRAHIRRAMEVAP